MNRFRRSRIAPLLSRIKKNSQGRIYDIEPHATINYSTKPCKTAAQKTRDFHLGDLAARETITLRRSPRRPMKDS